MKLAKLQIEARNDWPRLAVCVFRHFSAPGGMLRGLQREFEGEGCAGIWTIAVGGQLTPDFARGQRSAVQAKAVAVFYPCREAMIENLVEIGGRNADTVVVNGDFHLVAVNGDSNRNALIILGRINAGVLGIAEDVQQNLEDFVLVHDDFRESRRIFAMNLNLLFSQFCGINLQHVIH